MTRAARNWTAFAAASALVLGALGWVTHLALSLESREREARAEARFQETLRLALWRMDSAVAPIIAREATRPYFHYVPFYQEEVAYNTKLSAVQANEVLIPSPLLQEKPGFFRLHFEVDGQGVFSSPQVPEGKLCEVAVGNKVATPNELQGSRLLLHEISLLASQDKLRLEIERAEKEASRLLVAGGGTIPAEPQARWSQQTIKELNVRQQGANRARSGQSSVQQAVRPASPPRETVELGALFPLWCSRPDRDEPELLFLRRVHRGGEGTIQGVWMDWPKLKSYLLDEVKDLVPGAALAPVLSSREKPLGLLLANFPAVLEPRPALLSAAPALSPMKLTLSLAWGALLVSIAAVGVVLRAALDLGDRRGQFVSAVTHELRTPLTTFRLYSQMLADNMVTDAKTREEYLVTLKAESERLSRLVENVLLYARVEQNRAAARRERIETTALLERVSPRLHELAESRGMELAVDAEGARGSAVDVDPQAVEQILFNLVENSCKYAAPSGDPRLSLEARRRGRVLEILCRDHGPGIPEAESAKVFAAFRRAARDAQSGTPGLGLGLTLSRGLARQLGGDLELVREDAPGAVFRLTLPLAG